MFDLFDLKHDGAIDFREFARSMNTFHPDTPQEEKATCTNESLFMSKFLFLAILSNTLLSHITVYI